MQTRANGSVGVSESVFVRRVLFESIFLSSVGPVGSDALGAVMINIV